MGYRYAILESRPISTGSIYLQLESIFTSYSLAGKLASEILSFLCHILSFLPLRNAKYRVIELQLLCPSLLTGEGFCLLAQVPPSCVGYTDTSRVACRNRVQRETMGLSVLEDLISTQVEK